MENIRIQDDLYMHVNGETLDNLVIPDDRPSTGGFALLLALFAAIAGIALFFLRDRLCRITAVVYNAETICHTKLF